MRRDYTLECCKRANKILQWARQWIASFRRRRRRRWWLWSATAVVATTLHIKIILLLLIFVVVFFYFFVVAIVVLIFFFFVIIIVVIIVESMFQRRLLSIGRVIRMGIWSSECEVLISIIGCIFGTMVEKRWGAFFAFATIAWWEWRTTLDYFGIVFDLFFKVK